MKQKFLRGETVLFVYKKNIIALMIKTIWMHHNVILTRNKKSSLAGVSSPVDGMYL